MQARSKVMRRSVEAIVREEHELQTGLLLLGCGNRGSAAKSEPGRLRKRVLRSLSSLCLSLSSLSLSPWPCAVCL